MVIERPNLAFISVLKTIATRKRSNKTTQKKTRGYTGDGPGGLPDLRELAPTSQAEADHARPGRRGGAFIRTRIFGSSTRRRAFFVFRVYKSGVGRHLPCQRRCCGCSRRTGAFGVPSQAARCWDEDDRGAATNRRGELRGTWLREMREGAAGGVGRGGACTRTLLSQILPDRNIIVPKPKIAPNRNIVVAKRIPVVRGGAVGAGSAGGG